MVLVCWTATFADLVIILIIVIYHLSHLPSFISITMLFLLVYSVIMSRVLCYQSLAIILVKVKYVMPGFQLLLAHNMIIEAMSAKYYCCLRSSLQWRLNLFRNGILWQVVPFDMKGCICHFTKWQIHPSISKDDGAVAHVNYYITMKSIEPRTLYRLGCPKWFITLFCLLTEHYYQYGDQYRVINRNVPNQTIAMWHVLLLSTLAFCLLLSFLGSCMNSDIIILKVSVHRRKKRLKQRFVLLILYGILIIVCICK